jgi:ergothioneine biosynthesis protein EgtB
VKAVGHAAERGFAFDNETPRHRVLLEPYALASRPATNAEYAEFVEAGGYGDPRWWLSDGWEWVRRTPVAMPLYWAGSEGAWTAFTLAGRLPLAPDEPVTHVSYYEADAYARFRGARLATEFEWENAAAGCRWRATSPTASASTRGLRRLPLAGCPRRSSATCGSGRRALWAYPGFRAATGALGEYNGKFMCNQLVLRGGSCVSPIGHLRASYRNFFPPEARWQFSGIRLARDC